MSTRDRTSCIVAEVAQAHDGSLGLLHSHIDAAAAAGVDAVKFQTHIAQAESSPQEPFRVRLSSQDRTRFDYWQRMGFTLPQWVEIREHCAEAGVEFISSPFSNAAVELLEQVGVGRYKVGSGELGNLLLLERLAQTGKELILSTGMSGWDEIDRAVEFLRARDVRFSLMQCSSRYPTGPRHVGLNVLEELSTRYGVPVGLSDHSGTIFPALAAVTLGASLVELHVVFHKRMYGPDTQASVTFEDLGTLVEGVRFIEQARSRPLDKNDVSDFGEMKRIFGKSLAVNRDLARGHTLGFGDLEAKKPAGCGIAAERFEAVLGRRLSRPMAAWEFLSEEAME